MHCGANKNKDQKTFLAWPVHLYTNCLQLLVSAGPAKCLRHLPQVPWKSWKIDVCKKQFWEKISIIVIPTLTTRRRSGTCTPIPAQSVLTKTWMLLQKKNQHACEIISHSQTRPKNQPSLSPCPPCHHRLPFWQSRPFLASCILIPALHISDAATQLRESRFINNLWLDWKENLMIDLGKPQRKFISVHLGIARLGGGSKPLPGWFVAPIFRRNVHVQTGICMILPENRCHRVPVWVRGRGSNGYLGNAQMNRDFFMLGLPLY